MKSIKRAQQNILTKFSKFITTPSTKKNFNSKFVVSSSNYCYLKISRIYLKLFSVVFFYKIDKEDTREYTYKEYTNRKLL